MTSAHSQILTEVRDLMKRREYAEIVRRHRLGELRFAECPELVLFAASALHNQFEMEEARRLLYEASQHVFGSRDASLIRRWHNQLGDYFIVAGQLDAAARLFSDCLNGADEALDYRAISHASMGLGIVSSMRGDVDEAVAAYTRALAANQRIGNRLGVARCQYNMGLVYREWGRFAEAAAHFHMAEEYYGKESTPQEAIFTAAQRAVLLLEVAEVEMAEQLGRTAVARAELLGNRVLRVLADTALGHILLRSRGVDHARPFLERALVAAPSCDSIWVTAEVYEEMAILELTAAMPSKAEVHRDAAVSYYRQLGVPKHITRFLKRYADTEAATLPRQAPA